MFVHVAIFAQLLVLILADDSRGSCHYPMAFWAVFSKALVSIVWFSNAHIAANYFVVTLVILTSVQLGALEKVSFDIPSCGRAIGYVTVCALVELMFLATCVSL